MYKASVLSVAARDDIRCQHWFFFFTHVAYELVVSDHLFYHKLRANVLELYTCAVRHEEPICDCVCSLVHFG